LTEIPDERNNLRHSPLHAMEWGAELSQAHPQLFFLSLKSAARTLAA
jgi:hypothetical protein